MKMIRRILDSEIAQGFYGGLALWMMIVGFWLTRESSIGIWIIISAGVMFYLILRDL